MDAECVHCMGNPANECRFAARNPSASPRLKRPTLMLARYSLYLPHHTTLLTFVSLQLTFTHYLH